jgi:hypothetical protein
MFMVSDYYHSFVHSGSVSRDGSDLVRDDAGEASSMQSSVILKS